MMKLQPDKLQMALFIRATEMLRKEDTKQAEQAIVEFSTHAAGNATDLYNAACLFARSVIRSRRIRRRSPTSHSLNGTDFDIWRYPALRSRSLRAGKTSNTWRMIPISRLSRDLPEFKALIPQLEKEPQTSETREP